MAESNRFNTDTWDPRGQVGVAAPRRPGGRLGSRAYRVLQLVVEDLQTLRPRLRLVNAVVGLMPRPMLGWLRPSLYRFAGVRIGQRARIYGPLELTGAGTVAANISIGDDCMFTTPLFLNASATIRIGNHVTVGHHTLIITDTHQYDNPLHRSGPGLVRSVTIEDGAWIAAAVTILPGVTVGEGSVVAAGAVVTRDVPRHTMVGGVPAKVLKKL